MRPVVCFVVVGFWGVRSGPSQGVGSGVGRLGSAGAAGEDAEVGFDVVIAGEDTIVVEVDVVAGGAACTGEHGEEVDDVLIFGEDAVVVEVDVVASNDAREQTGGDDLLGDARALVAEDEACTAAIFEEFDAEFVISGLQSDAIGAFDHAVQAIVLDENVGADEHARAVVGFEIEGVEVRGLGEEVAFVDGGDVVGAAAAREVAGGAGEVDVGNGCDQIGCELVVCAEALGVVFDVVLDVEGGLQAACVAWAQEVGGVEDFARDDGGCGGVGGIAGGVGEAVEACVVGGRGVAE